MQQQHLSRPPYANGLRLQGGSLWLYCGAAQAWARVQTMRERGWYNSLLLPPGRTPDEYDWSCVAGLPVMVVELATTTPALRRALVERLAVYGASEVMLLPKPYRTEDVLFWNCGPAVTGVWRGH